MHVEIQRTDLGRLLTVVSKVVEPRNTYPILANVLLIAEPNRLVVRGTDLDIEISASAEATCEPGQTTVPARALADIVKKLAGDVVTLDLDNEDLVVKSGRSRFKLATLSADSFPDLKAETFTHSFTANIAELFGQVAFAISTEETRYYLNGIYLHANGKGKGAALRAVATDGHRMARAETVLPEGATGLAGIIVPAKTVRVIAAHAGDVGIEISTTKIRLVANDIVIVSKLIEGTFPDYERVTPKNNELLMSAPRTALIEAVSRVSVIASDRGGKAVKVQLAPDSLTLVVTNPDRGDATEELPITYAGAPFQIGFNAKYLHDVLANTKGDNAEFAFGDEGSPTLVRGDGTGLCVLMPMKV